MPSHTLSISIAVSCVSNASVPVRPMSDADVLTRDCDLCETSAAAVLKHRGVVKGRLCDSCADSLSDRLNTESTESTSEATQSKEIEDQRPVGGTSGGAGTTAKDMLTNAAERQNSTDSTERADSWREVYLKMGVFEVGHR
jgi:bacterioferritin-associated ferredoxin